VNGLYLLAPHSDDEVLFATYTLLRHRPTVVVCFAGRAGRHHVPDEQRSAETAAALRVLGCPEHIHLGRPADPPDWDELETHLRSLDVRHVWAPLPEEDGNSHHNWVGEMALRLWPGQVTLYATYTTAGKTTTGTPVQPQPGWEDLKRQALACYASQIANPGTRPHFERPLDEYETVMVPC
jgi:LmbE family N-acetylglucosaminyl deacetylase